ncbi:MAG: 16S rRNA (guanine(527)-N(7))-methyltransferase RsmG [Myxococcota bacterium]
MTGEADAPIALEPIRERIAEGLGRLGLDDIPPRADDRLASLVGLLAQWAPRMNLTGHRDPLEMTSRLVLDAAGLVSALPELGRAANLADLGSGAGFPGLPIAILRPHLIVHLIEARQKRHHFQREVRRQLNLTNARPIHGRSEALVPIRCEMAVAQAMAEPARALEHLAAWTQPGGLMILPATAGSDPPALPVGHRLEQRAYPVPFAAVHRLLWVVHRPQD